METETLDKIYLEWSQFTKARTNRELNLETEIYRMESIIKALQSKLGVAEDAFKNIDVVACDFGYYEEAAKTMKHISNEALCRIDNS